MPTGIEILEATSRLKISDPNEKPESEGVRLGTQDGVPLLLKKFPSEIHVTLQGDPNSPQTEAARDGLIDVLKGIKMTVPANEGKSLLVIFDASKVPAPKP